MKLIPKVIRLRRKRRRHGMTDHQSKYTTITLIAVILKRALERKQGRNLRSRLKLMRTVWEEVSYCLTRG